MSRVVYRPPTGHVCRPGCEVHPAAPDGPLAGMPTVSLPFPPDFPRGTVWECDCGTRWISLGVIPREHTGYFMDQLEWKREGWFARWRRQRKESLGG